MLSEGVIFEVWVAALISLQHTLLSTNTGTSYSYPLVISSMLMTIGLCLALSIVNLVVVCCGQRSCAFSSLPCQVVGGWAILVLFQPTLQSVDYCYVNASVGFLQVVGTLIDMSNALGRVSGQLRPHADSKFDSETSQVKSASGSKKGRRVSFTANMDRSFDSDGSRLEPFNPMVAGNLHSHRTPDPIRSGAHHPSLSSVFKRQFRLTHNSSDATYQAQFPFQADLPQQYLDVNADLIKKMK